MQSLSSSISRGKPFVSTRDMPRGGGLPLCLSGVCIMTQVPQKKTTLRSSSSRSRSSSRGSSRGSSATRDACFPASHAGSFSVNAFKSPSNYACEVEERTREQSSAVPADRSDHGATAQPPRIAVAREMTELDQQRGAIRERRSVQGLGPFLEEQSFLVARQARRPQEIIRSRQLQELQSFDQDITNIWLGNCGAKAA